jgi:hypothetical protein
VTRAEPRFFLPGEVRLALFLAAAIEIAFFCLLILAGENQAQIKAVQPPEPMAIPIAVKPVLDELPLLKLGGKKVRAKLPDMWKKQAPVQRFEEKSAPSAKAEKTPDAIPTSPLAELDAQAPPPDAEVAKQVDEQLLDAGPDAAPTVEGEGAADGVKEGTETDPLKARAVSGYRLAIIRWFRSHFSRPDGEIPEEELVKLSAAISVQLGPDRTVSGYAITRPSGNPIFDARVKSALDSTVGDQIPAPPPLYPDIYEPTLSLQFSGAK